MIGLWMRIKLWWYMRQSVKLVRRLDEIIDSGGDVQAIFLDVPDDCQREVLDAAAAYYEARTGKRLAWTEEKAGG